MIGRRALYITLIALAVLYAAAHIAALFTDGANWDEFALFHRAQETLQTGTLKGGGRPGLAVIPVLPFVAGCNHVMHVVDGARLAWSFVTFGLLAGLFVFLYLVAHRSPLRLHAAALGTASFALVPVFLRWSLQVRTDQPAIAAVLWAGVALMASRRRWWILAGGLAAAGYLCSQKAVYVVALVGLVALGDAYITGSFDWRRELRRVAYTLIGAVATVAAFQILVRLAFAPAHSASIEQGMNLFRWYRYVLRFRLYGDILPTVLPHVGLLVLIFIAAIRSFRRDTAERRSLLVALGVVTLGVAVGRFHTASFPYFWITIGLFPACAIALGLGGIRELLPRAHVAVLGVAWIAMLALAVCYRAETLDDSQALQRDTFTFVERLPANLRGFNSDGGLICRRDPDPLPVFLGQHITQRFGGTDGPRHVEDFIAEHRSRPISFLVRTNRVGFPRPIAEFWETHYVPYRGSVWLAGRRIVGGAGTQVDVDIVAPGAYRWTTWYGAAVRIGEQVLAPGDTIDLPAGHHSATLLSATGDGMLVLAVDDPPWQNRDGFYTATSLAELSGVRGTWW